MLEDMSEHEVQKTAVGLLRKAGVRFFAVPNGGLRNKATAAKLWAEGVERGVPDLVIIDPPPANPYHAGAVIEVKTTKGKPTPEQMRWLKHFSDCGWSVHYARGLAQLLKLLVKLGYLQEEVITPWLRLGAAAAGDSTAPAPTKATRGRASAAPGGATAGRRAAPRKGKGAAA